jgi:enoyl-CoA hydratase
LKIEGLSLYSAGRGKEGRKNMEKAYETLLYATDGPVASLTLNRPDRLNTIVPPMPDEIEAAVIQANRDPEVRVIVLRGAGRSFCAGFDFGDDFSAYAKELAPGGRWDPGADMIFTTSAFAGPVPKFMSLWRSPKPVIAQVHGWCVGGGSDMALCADVVIAAEDARIGTPYARVWGCYLTGLWIYRLGLTRTKWHALTGEPLSGREAAELGLVNRAVPFAELEAEVMRCAGRLAQNPPSQLAAMKLIVNQAYENMGLHSTQTLGPILDGYMRNTPEALRFVEVAAREGVGAAIAGRDGPFGDYSQAPRSEQPSRDHVVAPKPPSFQRK